jgi:uncharacterized tellurite resistance protein B-like protein
MGGKQELYHALGELAYAVAKSDGEIQAEEKIKLHEIIEFETRHHDIDFKIVEISFNLMTHENLNIESVYKWSISELKKHKFFLTEDMKVGFVSIIEKVAHAFNKVTNKEQDLITRLRKDLELI